MFRGNKKVLELKTIGYKIKEIKPLNQTLTRVGEDIVEKKGALVNSPLSLVKTSIKTIILFAENKFNKFGVCTFYILL